MNIKGSDINLTELFFNGSKNLLNLSMIALGSLIFILGLNGILVPHGFLSGGVVGLSILIHYLVPVIGVGAVYFLLNLPLVFLGWFNISRRFMITLCSAPCFFRCWRPRFTRSCPKSRIPSWRPCPEESSAAPGPGSY